MTIGNQHDPWLEANSEYYMISREGEPLRGVPCYAYPEVVERQLKYVKELVSYNADGIFFSTRTHSGPNAKRPLIDDQYGYNTPMVEEFKRRYGINPRTENIGYDYLWDKWQDMKGEYITSFIRKSIEIVHKTGQELWIGIYPRDTIMLATIQNSGGKSDVIEFQPPLCRARMQWRQWIEEKIIDALVVIPSSFNPIADYLDIDFLNFFKYVTSNKCRLLIWLGAKDAATVRKRKRLIEMSPADGIIWQNLADWLWTPFRMPLSDRPELWKPCKEPCPDSDEMWQAFSNKGKKTKTSHEY